MKKIRKSKQAILITFLVGFIVPKITIITGNSLVDSALFKVILGSCFYIATLIVGLLYSFKWLKGRKAGGIARIIIYFLLLIPILCLITPIGNLLLTIGMYLSLAVVGIALIYGIIFLIVHIKDAVEMGRFCRFYKVTKTKVKRTKNTREKSDQSTDTISVVPKCKSNSKSTPCTTQIPQVSVENTSKIELKEQQNIEHKPETVAAQTPSDQFDELCKMFGIMPNGQKVEKAKYTIDELWEQKNPEQDYITVTNDENPNLKDIRIYSGRRSDGTFKGYVLMNDARRTVYGEIYYANKKIWYIA